MNYIIIVQCNNILHTVTMEVFLGKRYVLVNQENYVDYMKFIGNGYLFRNVASTLKPIHSLKRSEDGSYEFTFESVVANGSISFKPDEEFEESLPGGGGKAKSFIKLEDNKMIHTQTNEKGQTSVHVREFFPDEMITTTTVNGFDMPVKRYYKLVTE